MIKELRKASDLKKKFLKGLKDKDLEGFHKIVMHFSKNRKDDYDE